MIARSQTTRALSLYPFIMPQGFPAAKLAPPQIHCSKPRFATYAASWITNLDDQAILAPGGGTTGDSFDSLRRYILVIL